MLVGLLATMRFHLQSGEGLNLSPSRQWPALIVQHEPEPERGPVLITVDYAIDPERSAEFARAMDEVRRIRLRDGALQWGLFSDSAAPGRHTVEKARGFHIGPEPPAVRRLIGEPVSPAAAPAPDPASWRGGPGSSSPPAPPWPEESAPR
jgi:hypothetical protein